MPAYHYCNNDSHGDDQLLSFTADNGNLLIGVVADGVSTCSCGHVASAFLCFYIREYFNNHFTIGVSGDRIDEFMKRAIGFATAELKKFTEQLQGCIPLPDETIEPTETKQEIDMPLADEQLLSQPEEISQPVVLMDTTPQPVEDDFSKYWKQYVDICTALGYADVTKNETRVKAEISRKQILTFNSTVSLNVLFRRSPSEYILVSINYGDSELYVIAWDPVEKMIDAFFLHYKLAQEKLKTYISATDGMVGTPVIFSRHIGHNDTIVITSDGAALHYTTKTGYPYEPFKRNFSELKSPDQHIDRLPRKWFDFLKQSNAVSDDYSMLLMEC